MPPLFEQPVCVWGPETERNLPVTSQDVVKLKHEVIFRKKKESFSGQAASLLPLHFPEICRFLAFFPNLPNRFRLYGSPGW